MIQGGETLQGPPQETHKFTGRIGAQKNNDYINRETCSYSTLYIEGREKRTEMYEIIPIIQGAHTQDIQMILIVPYSPTIHPTTYHMA